MGEGADGHGGVPHQLGLAETNEIHVAVAMGAEGVADEIPVLPGHIAGDPLQFSPLLIGKGRKPLLRHLPGDATGDIQTDQGNLLVPGVDEDITVQGPGEIPVVQIGLAVPEGGLNPKRFCAKSNRRWIFLFSADPSMIRQRHMEDTVYHELADHLDQLPGGFPSTPDGVELRILKRLFTEPEARLACQLTLIPETAQVVAYRCGIRGDSAAAMLAAMWQKGLILKHESERNVPRYMASQFVVGIWEFQVNRLTPELVADMAAYIPLLLDTGAWRRAPQMRTIPVNRSIDPKLPVLPHEAATALISNKDNFVVSPCICRKERRMAGHGCDGPLDTCISFGGAGSYFVQSGIGRPVDRQTVLALLETADRSGLVLQPSNSRDPAWLCCCCGCCCGVLRTIKTYPKPAELMAAPFVARLDSGLCTGCGVCADRCQMDALSLLTKTVQLDRDRCIGCGLCVSTCPTGALRLTRKPRSAQPRVPANMAAALLRTAWKRKKIGPFRAAMQLGRSQRDRYLAARRTKKDQHR
jgi:electron transport complex protein RnfB